MISRVVIPSAGRANMKPPLVPRADRTNPALARLWNIFARKLRGIRSSRLISSSITT
jgi:hypothetical protein